MRLGEDILRGLRWGAIVLAASLAGVLCYRVATAVAKAGREASTQPSRSPKPHKAAQPVPAATRKASSDVPPPPPSRTSRIAARRAQSSSPASNAQDVPELRGKIIIPDEDDDPPVTPKDPATNPVVREKTAPAVAAPASPATPANHSTNDPYESGAKKAVKAIGRFLRFGSNDN